MRVSDFDFELPPERIAQQPLAAREHSRLLVLGRQSGDVEHRRFDDLAEMLEPGDLVILNDTKVVPARLVGRKPTGGRVELLLIERRDQEAGEQIWRGLVRASRAPAPGTVLRFEGGLSAEVLDRDGAVFTVRLAADNGTVDRRLTEVGRMPLPPYISRPDDGSGSGQDRERYQTVYARQPGAVAAPTAGLHFSTELLARIEKRGVERAALTLHVGPGTFRPVRVERVEDHRLDPEPYTLPARVTRAIARTRERGGRVVAVGTTVVRVLESRAEDSGEVRPGEGRCGLFIYPGFRFRAIDALITNFHLPRSTLLMLVSAFAGREELLAAYREAIERGYRFYSYGDAMFVRPG